MIRSWSAVPKPSTTLSWRRIPTAPPSRGPRLRPTGRSAGSSRV
nr:MAG TPA: hypothetical protein [Caudoviricetes sp.]